MMQLIVLGSGAGGPFQGRNYTAQVLKSGPETFIIDCGEGTQHQLYHHRVKYDGVAQIFISHLHGDHVYGLMGLVTSFCLKRRTDPLTIYGPAGLRELVETVSRISGVWYPYELSVVEVDTTVHAKIFESKHTEVWTIPLQHRTLCTGWLFKEKPRAANILPEKIEEYQIPFKAIPAIKNGGDFTLPDGTVVPHEELTIPAKVPRSFAFCSDTAPSDEVVRCVTGVSVLYHEATFTNEHQEEAAYSGHSTAEQAADIARQAGAEKLLLGHISARYRDAEQHLLEAKAVFEPVEIVTEGGEYEV
jgi:ribonuclease Z